MLQKLQLLGLFLKNEDDSQTQHKNCEGIRFKKVCLKHKKHTN